MIGTTYIIKLSRVGESVNLTGFDIREFSGHETEVTAHVDVQHVHSSTDLNFVVKLNFPEGKVPSLESLTIRQLIELAEDAILVRVS